MNVKRTPCDKAGKAIGGPVEGQIYFYRGPSTGRGYDAQLGSPTMYFQPACGGTAQRVNKEDKIEPVA